MISGNDHYYDDDQNEEDGDNMMIIVTVMIKGCDDLCFVYALDKCIG